MTPEPLHIETIKKRSHFLRLNTMAGRFVVSSCILQMGAQPLLRPNQARIGYTVTKKIGNAVKRNYVKRRLREAARVVMPKHAKAGFDYVIIARDASATCDYKLLLRDMEFAFSRIDANKTPEKKTKA